MTITPTMAPTHSADRAIYTVTAVMSGVLYLVLLIAPILAVKLAVDLGFSEGQTGTVFSFELGAFGLATIPSYLWLRRVNIRTAMFGFGAVVIFANVLSGFITDFGPFVAIRVVAAAAAGSLTVIILGIGGKASDPARAFGLFILAQCITGAIVLFFFPLIFNDLPVGALYLTMAGLVFVVLPVARMLDGNLLKRQAADKNDAEKAAAPRDTPRFIAGLAAVFFLFASASGLWAFFGIFAEAAGISLDEIGFSLSVATILGIAAPLTVTIVGDRPRIRPYVIAGFLLMLVSIGLLFGLGSVLVFAISATLLNLGWNFLPAYLFSAINRTSGASPHALSTTNLLVGLGFSIGPLTAGLLLESTGVNSLLTTAAISLALGLASTTFALSDKPKRITPQF
ncbi:MFS transporter [Arthrobacter sp. S39]|uniref:MFS transporter n=1 Tax=Arthrobacter sp. S39 TaxID=2509720 RepID=UPI001037A159|nr:MFS transporter [Arthrobacter sp. S39]TAP44967.1 MFS transporter [Arthrobacter sp. S39]